MNQDQLKKRMKGIGGSDIAAIMGMSPWKTACDVWEEKLGISSGQEETPIMSLGTYLEAFIADNYSKKTGRAVQRRHQQFAHTDYNFIIANIDREIIGEKRGVGILEIKAMGSFAFRQAKRNGIPDYYALQLQHYLLVTGRSWGSFAVMNRDTAELLHFDVEPDYELHDMIKTACIDFWEYVESGMRPPEPEKTKIDLPKEFTGEAVMMDSDDWEKAVSELREAKDIVKQAKEIEEDAQLVVKSLMGDHELCEGAGARIYNKVCSGRKTFDKKALAKDNPELDLSKYEKTGKAYKQFKVYFEGVK